MAKAPDSSKSESWTTRVPNDLADLARNKAIDLGMLKLGGKPNTTLIIHAALRAWLELPNDISNIVSNNTSNDLSNGVIQGLESRLDKLSNAMSNTVKREELYLFKSEILQDVELTIANSLNSQAVVNAAGTASVGIATPEIRHNQLDLTDIPAIAVSSEIPLMDNLKPDQVSSEHPYPIGTELRFKDLSEHLDFNLINYSTYAKKQGITSNEYINQKAIAKGELWEITVIGVKKIATRIS